MRVIDYFFDKLLWALSESDPYKIKQQVVKKLIDISKMNKNDLSNFDLE